MTVTGTMTAVIVETDRWSLRVESGEQGGVVLRVSPAASAGWPGLPPVAFVTLTRGEAASLAEAIERCRREGGA